MYVSLPSTELLSNEFIEISTQSIRTPIKGVSSLRGHSIEGCFLDPANHI